MIKLLGLLLVWASLVSLVDYDPNTGKYTIDRYGDDFKPKPHKPYKPFTLPQDKKK